MVSSMVINNLNFGSLADAPLENDAPLVVDANAVKILKAARQLLQSVGRRNAQVGNILGVMNHPQLTPPYFLNFQRQFGYLLTQPDTLCFLRAE